VVVIGQVAAEDSLTVSEVAGIFGAESGQILEVSLDLGLIIVVTSVTWLAVGADVWVWVWATVLGVVVVVTAVVTIEGSLEVFTHRDKSVGETVTSFLTDSTSDNISAKSTVERFDFVQTVEGVSWWDLFVVGGGNGNHSSE